MRKVNEQDQAQKQEQDRAYECNIIAPRNEEAVWNQECDDNQHQPAYYLGSPESVLDGCALVLGRLDTQQHEGEQEMERAERKVHAMHSYEAIAVFAITRYRHVVEREVLELLDSPVREHKP